jgi:ketosteroid isomerase-like protein
VSQENADLVRRMFDAVFRLRDYQAAARALHPDAVWHNTAEFPGQRACVGAPAIVEFWQTLLDSFEASGTIDIERVVVGEDSVVLGLHSVGRGKASGLPLDLRWGASCWVRDGKVSRVDVHGDWAKALEAVGLVE